MRRCCEVSTMRWFLSSDQGVEEWGMQMRRIKVEELPAVTSPRGVKVRKVLSSDDVVVMNVMLDPG